MLQPDFSPNLVGGGTTETSFWWGDFPGGNYGHNPRWLVLAIFERLGVPLDVLRMLRELLTVMRIRFRTRHGVSDGFETLASVGQGCCLACLCAVLAVDLPLRRLARDCRGSSLGSAALHPPPGFPVELRARLVLPGASYKREQLTR